MNLQAITLFLTDISAQGLHQLSSFQQYSDSVTELELVGDWQLEFAQQHGINEHTIPWNLLRATHFNLSDETKTVVCCDPVLMQMTHRGAYLWGQQGIEFSKEEAIRVIANINEKLMGPGESFYLLSNHQWLFTSEQELDLNLPSFESYIGKDMFGFGYPGSDGVWWDKLATEIQMLVKQMIDYQGLTGPQSEHLINVHFWGNTKARLPNDTAGMDNSAQLILSNDSQLESLATHYKKPFAGLDFLDSPDNQQKHKSNQLSVVVSGTNSGTVATTIQKLIDMANQNRLAEVRIVTADKLIILSEKKSVWNKFLQWFKV